MRLILALLLLNIFLPAHSINSDSLENILTTQCCEKKAKTLNILGKYYMETDPDRSIKLAFQAHRLWNLAGDTNNKTSSLEIVSYAYLSKGKYDSSEYYLAKRLQLNEQFQDTLMIINLITNAGYTKYFQGDYTIANGYFNKAINLYHHYIKSHPAEKNRLALNFARLINNKATMFVRQGFYDSALVFLKQSLKIRQDAGAKPLTLAPVFLNIGGVCTKIGNHTLALEYYFRAAENYQKAKDTTHLAYCYGNIGVSKKKSGDTLEAIHYYTKAIRYYEITGDKRGIISNLNNLALLYMESGHYEQAIKQIRRALKLNKKEPINSLLADSYHMMAGYYLDSGNPEKAIEYGHKALKLYQKEDMFPKLDEDFRLLSKAYEQSGNNKLALYYYKKHKTIHDSIFNEQSSKNYNKLLVQLETEKKERQIEKLKRKSEKQKLESIILKNRQKAIITTAIIIVLLLVAILFSIYIKRKKDKIIHKQKILVHQKENELAKAELEKSKLKEQELEQSLSYKSKQLNTHALHMMQKNLFLQDIKNKLESINKKTVIKNRSEFQNIIHQINRSLHSDKEWDVFKLYFEEINRDYFKNLKAINPYLTTNEQRLCALIKLNMTIKEIASVLNLAPVSVKSARYRLKKKLGLDANADLEAFVKSL